MRILFFARLREALGDDSLELEDSACPPTVGELRALLIERASGDFAEVISDPNVFCAVNQQVVDDGAVIGHRDEIAFFPPMTGG